MAGLALSTNPAPMIRYSLHPQCPHHLKQIHYQLQRQVTSVVMVGHTAHKSPFIVENALVAGKELGLPSRIYFPFYIDLHGVKQRNTEVAMLKSNV